MVESAHIGSPPATERDYYIVRAYLRLNSKYSGNFNADPTNGFNPAMRPPPGYVYNDKQTGIIAAYSIMLVFIFTITTLRLCLRLFKQRLRWGPDDWAIIPATVSHIRTSLFCLSRLTNRVEIAWYDVLCHTAAIGSGAGWWRKTVRRTESESTAFR